MTENCAMYLWLCDEVTLLSACGDLAGVEVAADMLAGLRLEMTADDRAWLSFYFFGLASGRGGAV